MREIAPALSYYQKTGFRIETLLCLSIQARANRDLGKEAEALASFGKVLSAAKDCGDKGQMGIAEQGMALILLQQEKWPQALEHFERYYEIAKSTGDPDASRRALLGQSRVLWRLGRYSDAERSIGDAQRPVPPAASDTMTLTIADAQAGMALSRGKYAEAGTLARGLYEAKSATSADAAPAKCLAGLAVARSGSVAAGKSLCAEGVAVLAGQSDRFALADARIAFAEILLANGEHRAAAEQAQHAIEVIEPAGRLESSWRAWLIAARAYRRAGDSVRSSTAIEIARKRLGELRQSWPADYFDSYSTRPDIRLLLSDFQR